MEDDQGNAPQSVTENGAARGMRGPEITRKVFVRLFDHRDSVHELTELLHRAYKRHADRGMRAIAAFQDDMTTVKRIQGGECYVAVLRDDERRMVGTIIFKDAANTKGTPWFERGDVASFSQLALEPWLQGRGIGGMLIRTAERRAVETGAAEIALSTPEPATELLAMYGHKGYRVVEHMNWPATNYRSAIMSKPTRQVRVEAAAAIVVSQGSLPHQNGSAPGR
jgi:GNAT superfamily N-acetyltransferase